MFSYITRLLFQRSVRQWTQPSDPRSQPFWNKSFVDKLLNRKWFYTRYCHDGRSASGKIPVIGCISLIWWREKYQFIFCYCLTSYFNNYRNKSRCWKASVPFAIDSNWTWLPPCSFPCRLFSSCSSATAQHYILTRPFPLNEDNERVLSTRKKRFFK